MSVRYKQIRQRGPQLPSVLQEKLGVSQRRQRPRFQVNARKQIRHEERGAGQYGSPNKRRKLDHSRVDQEDEDKAADTDEEPDTVEPVRQGKSTPRPPTGLPSSSPSSSGDTVLENSDTVTENLDYQSDSDESIQFPRDLSPEIVLDANSQTFLDRQREEDDEIAALERKLGGGRKKGKNKVFVDDDFDDVLGHAEGQGASSRSSKEWLKDKRRKAVAAQSNGSKPQNYSQSGSEEESASLDSEPEHDDTDDEDFEGFDEVHQQNDDAPFSDSGDSDDSEKSDKDKPTVKKLRENPYVAPPTTDGTNTKYIPPARRRVVDTEVESKNLDRLRKQAQGHLNKLSEANIISIVDEFQNLYLHNPRQDVTTVLLDLLFSAFAIPSTLQHTFIILHAAFVSALYKLLGADFGAEVLVKLVEAFQKWHQTSNVGKESLNLISLLANLFTFNLVSARLVFEHVKLLLAEFSENNAELLLRVVRDCGPQLRAEDPNSLKEIVQLMGKISRQRTEEGKPLNVRTRVMIDTITDLKNNKMRQATNSAGIVSEHLTRMRKALGSLNTRQLRGTEPLGISLDDIRNSDKRGKWWLVGASWRGNNSQSTTVLEQRSTATSPTKRLDSITTIDNGSEGDLEPDYAALAQHYKMNTTLRKQLFCTIMSALDARDAYARLTKLHLTRKQLPEIPRVLLRCCRAEPLYNAYYAVVAKQLLRSGDIKQNKMAFSIALWKFLEEISDNPDRDRDDDDDDEEHSVQIHEIANVARMYAHLIAEGLLPLSNAIRTLDIDILAYTGTNTPRDKLSKSKSNGNSSSNVSSSGKDDPRITFLELLLITILTYPKLNPAAEEKLESNKSSNSGRNQSASTTAAGAATTVKSVFSTGLDARQAKNILFFLEKHVKRTELLDGDVVLKKRLRRNLRVVVEDLESSFGDGFGESGDADD